MNWVFINGSPRKNGNTNYALERLKEALVAGDDSFTSHMAYDRAIGPCTDCRICKGGDLVCRKNDGMSRLYRELEGADVIVMGSPVYWSGISGPMKNLVDRLRPYYGSKRLAGKRLIVVTTGASADEESDLIETSYRRVCGALGAEFSGHVVANGFDIGDLERAGFDAEAAKRHIKLG